MAGVGVRPSISPQKVESRMHASNPGKSEDQGQSSPIPESRRETHALTDVKTIIAFKADLTPSLLHQPKVSEHRGKMQKARNRATVTKILGSNIMDDHERGVSTLQRGPTEKSTSDPEGQGRKRTTKLKRRSTVNGKDSPSSGSGDSGKSEENEKTTGDEDVSWDAFLNEGPVGGDEELMESGPLYEMANVDIVVEEQLAEMKEALRASEKQGRLSDRERTILMDKFSLFLQALVSSQENEVELIDHIGMKTQIIEVLSGFSNEETTTELMISEQKVKDDDTKDGDVAEFSKAKIVSLPEEASENEESESELPTVAAIDEMNAATIRESLLSQKNRLEMQEQMKVIHLLEIKQLEFEKTLLSMHYSKMIKPADLQKEMRELRKAITDMKIEIGTMQQEIAQIQLDIAGEEKSLREEESVTNQLDLDTLSKQIEVTQNASRPLHLSKDADREAHKLEQLQDTLEELEQRWIAGMTKFRAFQGKIDQKNSEYATLMKEETRMNMARKQVQSETERILADIELLQKKEQGLLNKARVAVEKTGYNLKLKKKLYEQHHAIYNESTRAQREYQKLERNIKMARETFLNAKLAHEKMRSAFETLQPKGDSDNWEKLRKLFTFEIEQLKVALDKRITDSQVQATNLEALQEKLNELYEDQVACGKDLQGLTRATVRKRRERQDKAEQCIKLEAQLHGIVTDIRMKKLVLDDCARNERELNRVGTLIQKHYSQIKLEKAAILNDLIQARQRVTEQSEKFKIANNEVESYINQSQDRQKEITRIHYLLLNAGLARDSVRNDALRAVQKFRFHRVERDELKMSNENTRREISRLRKDVLAVRFRFDMAIEESSKVASRLRERTEEVCTFIERIQAYEMILLKATGELRLREMEKAKLNSTLHEVKTHLMIVISKEPNEIQYVKQIEDLRREFSAITRERRALEEELSNTTRAGRVRELHHEWIDERETPPQLEERINSLESLLATREVRILERGLTLKQVDELTEGNMAKANQLKSKFECEVKYLVGMRKRLVTLSNRIDGMICETSLALTRADSVESEYMTQKRALLVGEHRFERGLPPSRHFQQLWNRKCWQKEMLQRSKSACKRVGSTGKPRPTGAGVVMERLRPKPKAPPRFILETLPKPACDFSPVGRCCPQFPYKTKGRNRKLSCIKPAVSRLPTGLRLCQPTPKPPMPKWKQSLIQELTAKTTSNN